MLQSHIKSSLDLNISVRLSQRNRLAKLGLFPVCAQLNLGFLQYCFSIIALSRNGGEYEC
ncbi:hypothetical protein GCM10026986_02320 [Nitrincola alkalisediminis]